MSVSMKKGGQGGGRAAEASVHVKVGVPKCAHVQSTRQGVGSLSRLRRGHQRSDVLCVVLEALERCRWRCDKRDGRGHGHGRVCARGPGQRSNLQ